ncbi:hypothetical protein MLD38_039849 [Melastoma candidum]|uniref:Uncharacterized protein n=1 Tax=Melastoma candidum TaxID=119954 RepID=A0ACB9L4U4_9MYRT|nr:hypothetical protein MLD38_039849 [Melastoma candidum]
MREGAAEPLPDHLRCNRTDGRQWRCGRRVMGDKKLCEIHYLQGKHRQNKEKVPESLKLERSRGRPRGKSPVVSKMKIRAQKMKKRKLGKELMRMLVEREVEKRREVQQSESVREGADKEDEEEVVDMMRRLPHGVMVISQSPVGKKNAGLNDRSGGNVGSLYDVKVGENGVNLGSRRRFRSKNLEPLPLGMVQVLPCKRNLENGISRKRCHWCKRGNSSNLTKCSGCKKLFYCMDCISERYHDTREKVKRKCPVCRKACRCSECSTSKLIDAYQEPSSLEIRADKILCSHYLISTLLPVIKKINQEKSIELEVEAKLRGMDISEVQIQLTKSGVKERCCNSCKIPILDLHRSCSNCSYSLCLSCYWDSQRGVSTRELKMKSVKESKICLAGYTQPCEESITKRKRGQKFGGRVLSVPFSLSNSKSRWNHGVKYCPHQEFGGCGSGLLCLQSMFPSQLMNQLETNAEEIACSYDFLEGSDSTSPCPLCPVLDHNVRSNELQEAASRRNSNDNFLYCPTSAEICSDKREHFQKHWGRGHPVIVRSVLKRNSELSWDPINLFCAYLENCIATREKHEEMPKGLPCLEWCEVEICANQVFMGSLRGQAHKNVSNEVLKMKGWLSSNLFREQFSAHYTDIVQALPLQEYMNPSSGLLNLTTGRPMETISADFGPYVHILYSNAEDHEAPTVSKLCYDLCDMVYLLASTSDELISMEKIKKIKKLMKKRQGFEEEDLKTVSSDELFTEGINEEGSCPNKNASEDLEKIEEMRVRKRMARLCSVSAASDELYRPICYSRYSLHDDACSGFDSSYLMSIGRSNGSEDAKSCGEGLENCKFKRKQLETSGGAQWDVFRREDVPKIIEYFKMHTYNSIRSYDIQEHLVHPIFDQCFFLDAIHKMRLKEEFDVEPWTFEQQVGEAVIIPAGCPYQIRNPKSCVNVVLHFISPESVGECIHLIDELRRLPEDHEARADRLEVKRMAVNSISRAIRDIRELTLSTNKGSSE